jgi:Phosphotransferase system mannitol/fructose-specific IIA domain (Ntr-type)
MEIKTSIKPVKILMYTAQRSIAYINENLITDAVNNISMTSVFNTDEFNKQISNESYDILVTNGFNDGLKHTPDIVINGLIDDTTISRLKKLVSDNYFHNNLNQMFPKENYLYYENRSNNYFKVLKNVLKYFIENEQLDQKMSVKLLNREEEGNQLMINHVALPHAVNETNFSRIFAVDLKTPLKLNKTNIYLILIVIVNDKNDDYKQLFNYLYKILNGKQATQVNADKSYESILKYFRAE